MNKKTACQEEADRILAYMKENYSGEITLNSRKFIHATREISDNDKIRTYIFLSVFTGGEFNLIGAYMKAYIKGYAENEGCEISKYVSTLEELKELEAKAKDLEHYTLNLGLWK